MATRKRSSARIQVEPLQDRCLPAVLVGLAGTEVSFLGDFEGYYVALDVDEAGYLRHNVESLDLNSFIDLDPATPGDQSLLADQVSKITMDLSEGGGSGVFTMVKPPLIDFTGGYFGFTTEGSTDDSSTIFSANGFSYTAGGSSTNVTIHNGYVADLRLGNGNDYVNASDFTLFGISLTTNDGDDIFIGTPEADFIWTGAGNDNLDGRAGDDALSGDDYGQTGNDTLLGGDGDDFLNGWLGLDTYDGGQGNDLLGEVLAAGTFIATPGSLNVDSLVQLNHHVEGFFVDGTAGNDFIDVRQIKSPCFINGYEGDDTIYGSSADDNIAGGDGNNTIDGRKGNDSISAGIGDDSLIGGAGDDSITGGDGNDTLSGDAGNDVLAGDAGDDTLTGGAGNDVLRGGTGDDDLQGDGGNDDLNGEGGTDVVHGGAGDDNLLEYDEAGLSPGDSLYGEGGDDVIWAAGGGSVLFGGSGDDTLYGTFVGPCTINAGGGNDVVSAFMNDLWEGGGGNDTLRILDLITTARITNSSLTLDGVASTRHGFENFQINGAYQCVLDASGYTVGHVFFTGSFGDDILRGSENDDTLAGGPGHDQLYGNAGDDLIRADGYETSVYDLIVVGGAGADTFEFYNTPLPSDATRQQLLDFLASAGVFHDLVAMDSFRLIND